MGVSDAAAEPDRSPRDRLVAAAVRLFYADGIQAIGVDRLIAEAGVTKATFYRHFPSKDDLVLAYLEHEDLVLHKVFGASTADRSPDAAIEHFFTGMVAHSCGPGFRGCPFINAAAEYPDPAHPVRQFVTTHRTWFRTALHTVLTTLDHPSPTTAARQLVFLRDGILIGSYLDDPETTLPAVRQTIRDVLTTG
ncbi:TetR/AcrR family transcriptional regulator [Nocardia sp. NPDC050710]|uniref:TetR/AcrR family transcriptional regulator n=1 Tax=Nocardia sp. NPDC050710 TaxID=3157220 RepID=UPI0033FF8611